jgi:predicted dehydrogenase
MIRLGVIGFGTRIQGLLEIFPLFAPEVKLAAITDLKSPAELAALTAGKAYAAEDLRYFSDADAMLDAGQLDGILIGTRCSLHTQFALKVYQLGLPLFLEKPVATDLADLRRLRDAGMKHRDRTVVSFPLRLTNLCQETKAIIDSGILGPIEHAQAWNNVPYGRVYFFEWYRDEQETGGLFLQKATHDFDYLNFLLDREPVWIAAMKSKQIYRGDHPAGRRCDGCPETGACPESPRNLYTLGGEWERLPAETPYQCGFATDTGNEDSGSALVEYEGGMHLAYSQNFFVRKTAGRRGARLMGHRGTVEFDWYTNEVKVMMHFQAKTEVRTFAPAKAGHGGGDLALAMNFIDVIRGVAPSLAPLDAGLRSVYMCLAAKASAENHTFRPLDFGTFLAGGE